MIERRVDVRAEPVGIDCRRVRERRNRGVCSNELTGAHGDQLADRDAIACHDERLASVEGAHDVAAAVAEFALGDFAGHNGAIVAHVLRQAGNARMGSRKGFRPMSRPPLKRMLHSRHRRDRPRGHPMTVQLAHPELKTRHRAMWASGDYP